MESTPETLKEIAASAARAFVARRRDVSFDDARTWAETALFVADPARIAKAKNPEGFCRRLAFWRMSDAARRDRRKLEKNLSRPEPSDRSVERQAARETLEALAARLTPFEIDVLREVFERGKTRREVAEEKGVPVRVVENAAIKIRTVLLDIEER